MLCGEGRVGKSSLLDTLIGNMFKALDSTRCLQLKTASCAVDSSGSWKELCDKEAVSCQSTKVTSAPIPTTASISQSGPTLTSTSAAAVPTVSFAQTPTTSLRGGRSIPGLPTSHGQLRTSHSGLQETLRNAAAMQTGTLAN